MIELFVYKFKTHRGLTAKLRQVYILYFIFPVLPVSALSRARLKCVSNNQMDSKETVHYDSSFEFILTLNLVLFHISKCNNVAFAFSHVACAFI